MKVYTKVVWQMIPDGMVLLEEESYDWDGAVALAKGGGEAASTKIPEFQQEAQKNLINAAESQFASGGPEVFTGDRVAGFTQNQLAGQQGAVDFSQGGAQSVANQSQDAFTFGLNAADPQANPFFASTAQALINPLTQTLQNQILPGIDSGAVQAGQVGSSRQGIAQGNAVQAFSNAAGDALSKFGSNAFGQGLNTFSQTLAQAPTVQNVGLNPSQIQAGVGDAQQQMQQQLINAQIAQFNQQQNRPVDALNQYASVIGGGGAGGGAETTGGTTASGGLSGALGGAATGAATGALFGPAGSTTGAAVGLGLGALAGFFS